MTHVTHLSYRTSGGGAARSASRIHRTMLQRGVDSALLAVVNESDGREVYSTQPSMNPLRRIYRHTLRTMHRRQDQAQLKPDAACSVFTSDRSFRGTELIHDLRDPDVIHMHWVAEMFDESRFLSAASRKAPIAWTMRDMRPITGGCHYDLGCGRFRSGCGNCPQLADSGPADLSQRIWRRRAKSLAAIPASRLIFVAPSHWLAGEFKGSPLCVRFAVHVIPNGVDTDLFRPAEPGAKPTIPGIDPSAFVILFNAASLDNRIKGIALLQSALRQIGRQHGDAQTKLQVLVVGSGDLDDDFGIETIRVGHLDSNEKIAEVYQAADVFAIPSLQDNCPNTVLESFACGVPVVGFDTSGIPDLVKPDKTGLLAKAFEPSDLADKIMMVAGDDQRRRSMSENCRQQAINEYSREIETQRYLDLYQQILDAQN